MVTFAVSNARMWPITSGNRNAATWPSVSAVSVVAGGCTSSNEPCTTAFTEPLDDVIVDVIGVARLTSVVTEVINGSPRSSSVCRITLVPETTLETS